MTIQFENFKARPYQVELLEKAIERDIIVYLKTGSGKTYIAVRLIQEVLKRIDPSEKIIFLANTVPLVQQQCKVLREFIDARIEEYYGERRIDNNILDTWSEAVWKKELEKNQILVMSPVILVDILDHSFISLDYIRLIVFDECHHATGKHPYSQILDKINNADRRKIKILGLSASIVAQKCHSVYIFKHKLSLLENKFGCKVETAAMLSDDQDLISKILNRPKIKIILTNSSGIEKSVLYEKINELKKLFTGLEERFMKQIEIIKSECTLEGEDVWIFLGNSENPYKVAKREVSDGLHILKELGIWSFGVFFQTAIERIKRAFEPRDMFAITPENAEMISNLLDNFFNQIVRSILSKDDEANNDKIFVYSSSKLNSLLDILKTNETKGLFHSIVFVQTRVEAACLSEVLEKISELSEWKFIKSDFIYSDSSSLNSFKVMNAAKQAEILTRFRNHEINILVATNIVEEGLDVPACNMVIRFSRILNFGSFVQSKGRARSKDSTFYILADEETFQEGYQIDLKNFCDIENDLENNLIRNRNEEDDDFSFSDDEITKLNELIKPYLKGKSCITCFSAISLVNRYCSMMMGDDCCLMYPAIYKIEKDEKSEHFSCKLRLPPNSVIKKTITSEKFSKKSYAKMDAALKMCIELDKAGEFTDYLTFLEKKEWLSMHYNLDEDKAEDDMLNKKVGTVKNKRGYEIIIADEFKNSHPAVDRCSHLFRIDISESAADMNFEFAPILENCISLGYLNEKHFEDDVPEFELFRKNNKFKVSIKRTGQVIRLTNEQFEILKKLHLRIFVELLNISYLTNFEENSLYGGFVVFLKENNLDWTLINSISQEQETVYQRLESMPGYNEYSLKGYLIKSSFNDRLMLINKIKCSMNPQTEFPNQAEADSFSEYFFKKYKMPTLNAEQALVSVDFADLNQNFILRNNDYKINNKLNKIDKREHLFIAEHLKLVIFDAKQVFALSMLPSIFYRANSLLKAKALKLIIENELIRMFNLKKNQTNLSWNNSIKFHKIRAISDTTKKSQKRKYPEVDNFELLVENSEDSENEDGGDLMFIRTKSNLEIKIDLNDNQKIPDLIVSDRFNEEKSFFFPNEYQILQCLTLKSANDDFDLERYEILGDCFLKLVVVLQIYLDFFDKSEGKMAALKSQRVSNRYLFKLAMKKNLGNFIVSHTFEPKVNWLGPNMSLEKLNELQELNKLSDKWIADSVEALIGVYLINLGSEAAKGFIEWLGFTISDQKGEAKLSGGNAHTFPDPLSKNIGLNNELRAQYQRLESFENKLQYSFKNKAYLYQATTHPSEMSNCFTSSYQKLELVGDAVLDMLVTQYIFSDQEERGPGYLTNLRAALVNNRFFCHLAVKHGFHKYLKCAPAIFTQLQQYVKAHGECSPDAAYLGFSSNIEDNMNDFEIEAPKCLADVFEAVAGAIYLDSNGSLPTVWITYYKILKPYLTAFKNNTPRSAIAELQKLRNNQSKVIEYKQLEEDKTYEATLVIGQNEPEVFIGHGTTRLMAKQSAYKKAVRALSFDKDLLFF